MKLNTTFNNLSALITKKPKRFLSIDFGRSFLKIAYFSYNEKDVTLLAFDIKKVAWQDDNKSDVIDFISGFLSKQGISAKDVYLTVNDSQSLVIKMMNLPVLSKEEMLEAVKWKLNDETAVDIDTSIFDWQIVKEVLEDSGEKKYEIMGVAAKAQMIQECLAIINSCKLIAIGISSPFLNYKYLLNHLEHKTTITAILDVGSEESTLCIYKNNQLHFIRVITFSFDKIAHSLTGVLSAGKGKVELSVEKAQAILKDFGIPDNESDILSDDIQASLVISLIRPSLEVLTKEIKLTFNYFASNYKEVLADALYITGDGANIKHLDSYLSQGLKINVSYLPLNKFVQTKKIDVQLLQENQNYLSSVVGAAMSAPDAINLLPVELKTKKIELFQNAFLRMFTVFVVSIYLVSFLMLNLEVYNYKTRLDNARSHLQIIQQIKLLRNKIDVKEKLINQLQKNKIPDHVFLNKLKGIISDEIVLEELSLDMPRHRMILKGKTFSKSNPVGVLTRFIKRLKDSSFFEDVSLVNSENQEGVQMFEIQGSLVR